MAMRKIAAVVAGIIILASGAFAGVAVAVFGLPYGPLDYKAFGLVYTVPDRPFFHLAIDADPFDGVAPCAPVNNARFVGPGETYQVAVCLMKPPEAPRAFDVRVLYDGALNLAPECADDPANPGPGEIVCPAPDDTAPALDDNPDANAGTTTWPNPSGQTLGGGFDCTSFGSRFPMGDDPGTVSQSDAVMFCTSFTGPLNLSAGGPLALLTFEQQALGSEMLTFGPGTVIFGADLVDPEIGNCGVFPPREIPCFGAQIWKVENPPRFDCDILFEDDRGRGTSLCVSDHSWQFDGPGFMAAGVDVMYIGDFVLVFDKPDSMLMLGFGNGPNGPGRAFVVDYGGFPLRLLMLEDVTP